MITRKDIITPDTEDAISGNPRVVSALTLHFVSPRVEIGEFKEMRAHMQKTNEDAILRRIYGEQWDEFQRFRVEILRLCNDPRAHEAFSRFEQVLFAPKE